MFRVYNGSQIDCNDTRRQIFLWGVLLMAQAASRNFTDLAVLRILSGAAEATADPAFVLITSTWYTREQQPSRIGYWYL